MFVLFLAFWILLNSKITWEILIFGLVIAGAVFAFTCHFMDYSLHKELLLWKSAGLLLAYFGVLLREIALANLNVLKLVYSPRYEPEPGIVYFSCDLKSGIAKVLLANSITLTPGTVTLSVEGNTFCVHCLDKSFGDGIEECVFVQLLRKMEKSWEGGQAK